MKKSLIVIAALAAAGAASAQSSVTLYGVADVSYGYTKSGDTKHLGGNPANLSGSRVGIKGAEDLGNGLKATFNYEWSLDSLRGGFEGAGKSTPFEAGKSARQGWVGLAGSFGEFRLGTTNTPVDNLATAGTADGMSGFDTTAAFAGKDGLAIARVKGVHYFGNFSGLGVQAFAGYGEDKVGGVKTKRQGYGLGVNYATGPLLVGVAGHQFKDVLGAAGQPTEKLTQLVVGGAYDFNVAKLIVNYVHHKEDDGKYREFNVGVNVPFGAASFVAEYGYNKDLDKNLKHDFMVGANYAFSKRTDTYVRFAQFGKGDAKAQKAAVGLRHKF